MISSSRKNEIRKIAKNISKASEKFQLIHATYACQTLIKQIVLQDFKEKYDGLLLRIEEKISKDLNYDAEWSEKERLDILIKQRAFHIDVAYIPTKDENAARVIKIDNAFVINLSKSLSDKICDEDGNYNYEVIQKIRHLMAHELGHLVLHTDELLKIDGTLGSKLINDEDREAEANCFKDEVIKLRKERNEKIYKDGGAHKMF